MIIQRILNLDVPYSCFVFGPRQCGKTTLVESFLNQKSSKSWEVNLLQTEILFKYLKDPSLFRKEALYTIEKEGTKIIFIDEVQKIPPLLDEIHWLIEKTPCYFILTGSSARKLKRGGANLLAGRALQKCLFPFIYREIKQNFILETALHLGTLPGVYEKPEDLKQAILKTYVDTYLKEEIQQESVVRNLGHFARFLELAAAGFTEITNYSNIARECGVSSKTVQGYYDILEDTLIGFRLLGWTKSVRKQLASHPKFYFFDNGITNALMHTLQDQPNLILRGRLFEQWIMNEIKATHHYMGSETQLFYWRTNNDAEVDIVLAKGNRVIVAVEIKATQTIRSANLTGLKSFLKEHPHTRALVISEVHQPYFLNAERTIEILPWQRFLEQTIFEIL